MKFIIPFLAILVLSFSSFAEEICSETSGNAALVVIDMQPYFANRAGRDKDPKNQTKMKELQDQQIAIINRAKIYGIPVIFIEYEHPSIKDRTSEQLQETAKGHNEVRFIKKTTDGMFSDRNKYKAELAAYLKQKQIGTLIITGANGGACVRESITGALQSNCNVVALNKGIADFNFPDFIYPYTGYYSRLKPDCKSCTFKEVSSVENATVYMVNNSGRYKTGPTPSKGQEKGTH